MRQSIQAATPSSSGEPVAGDGAQLTPANFSPPDFAKRLARSSWPSPRTFAQKCPLASIAGQLVELLAGDTATSGGSSETDMNEPTTSALGFSGSPPVTTTTPVGRRPRTVRKFSEKGLVSSEGSGTLRGSPNPIHTSTG